MLFRSKLSIGTARRIPGSALRSDWGHLSNDPGTDRHRLGGDNREGARQLATPGGLDDSIRMERLHLRGHRTGAWPGWRRGGADRLLADCAPGHWRLTEGAGYVWCAARSRDRRVDLWPSDDQHRRGALAAAGDWRATPARIARRFGDGGVVGCDRDAPLDLP